MNVIDDPDEVDGFDEGSEIDDAYIPYYILNMLYFSSPSR